MSVATIIDLIKEEELIISELNDARVKAVVEKEKSDLNEAALWLQTNFKEKGLTNDKMRNAYVTKQKQVIYPDFYNQEKARVSHLEDKLKFIRQTIEVMMRFELKEVEGLEFWEEREAEKKNEGTEGPVSLDEE